MPHINDEKTCPKPNNFHPKKARMIFTLNSSFLHPFFFLLFSCLFCCQVNNSPVIPDLTAIRDPPRFNCMNICSLFPRIFLHLADYAGHVPAEVVIAQSKTAGVHFSSCEPPSSQRRRVPVDALSSWVAVAPCASVPFTPSHHTLLTGVCWRDRLS